MGVDLEAEFDAFLNEVSIGEPQTSRMESAVSAITSFLAGKYGVRESSFFLQGSYPNNTAVEPVEGGEYDVDLVAVCVDPTTGADDSLDTLADHFKSDGRYRDRVVRKKPCVRLEYAPDDVGKFHVDVVPVRKTQVLRPPLEAPRRRAGWHETAPSEYTQWCLSKGENYARTVKILKRWRDEQQSVRDSIKSIVLQVLIAEHMPQALTDADRVARTIRGLHSSLSELSGPPTVINPVLPAENLAARWTVDSFESFVQELEEAVEWVDKAEGATDKVEAAEAWREILGEDFPSPTPAVLGLALSDTSHEKSIAAKGWRLAIDPRYSVEVSAQQQRGKRGQNRKALTSGNTMVFAGHRIRFKAHIVAPGHCQVWWQVTNTGQHATNKNQLRGEFLQAKNINENPSNDRTVHWERTAYTGVHRVRALLVREEVVVALGGWFEVPIWSPNWRHMFGR